VQDFAAIDPLMAVKAIADLRLLDYCAKPADYQRQHSHAVCNQNDFDRNGQRISHR